jgi:hypothetical protein
MRVSDVRKKTMLGSNQRRRVLTNEYLELGRHQKRRVLTNMCLQYESYQQRTLMTITDRYHFRNGCILRTL